MFFITIKENDFAYILQAFQRSTMQNSVLQYISLRITHIVFAHMDNNTYFKKQSK